MLGYAVVFKMHEQGMPLLMGANYSPCVSTLEEAEKMRDTLIHLCGVLDSRYTRETYQIIDVTKLHHEIALGVVSEQNRDIIRDVLPEIWEVAMKGGGSGYEGTGYIVRVTYGWRQQQMNRNMFDKLVNK